MKVQKKIYRDFSLEEGMFDLIFRISQTSECDLEPEIDLGRLEPKISNISSVLPSRILSKLAFK